MSLSWRNLSRHCSSGHSRNDIVGKSLAFSRDDNANIIPGNPGQHNTGPYNAGGTNARRTPLSRSGRGAGGEGFTAHGASHTNLQIEACFRDLGDRIGRCEQVEVVEPGEEERRHRCIDCNGE